MRSMQPTLINYSSISQFYQLACDYGSKVFLSQKGVIHTERIICCGKPCSYNGSNNSGHIVSRSQDSIFKNGQQKCNTCGKTHQIENDFIIRFKEDLDQMILSEALSLREFHTSYSDIAKHLERTRGIKISSKTIEDVCNAKLESLESLEIEYEIEDDYYCYDEQWIKVDGKKMLRVVIFDYKNNRVIYEKTHGNLTKKVLEDILLKVFNGKIPKGFIFDMQPMYPNAFKRVFGKKIRLQFCVFHLHKLILREYESSLKIGKKVKWTVMHYYNLYTLFNILYNRTKELELLKEMDEQLKAYKEKIEGEEDISVYTKDIKFPKSYKSLMQQKEYIVRLYEKELMKTFREHLHQEKLRRKREKQTLKTRKKEDAREQLDQVISQINYYPKKIQERIKKIEKSFDLFTATDGEVLTNNRLEGFFGSTLKKFRKKAFHSLRGVKNFLLFQKMKYLGIEFTKSFSFQKNSLLFGVIAFFQR